MFDLNNEVKRWSRSVHRSRCGGRLDAAELEDHLHCEIEALQATGLSEEEAFAKATKNLGDAVALADEHFRNRSAFVRGLHGLDAKLPKFTAKQAGALNIGVSLLFAGAILLSAMMLKKDPDQAQMVSFLLIALWFVPFSYLASFERRKSAYSCRGRKGILKHV